MMTLHTRVADISDNRSVTILWRTGTKNKGAIRVKVTNSGDDADILAELVAIRHLLFRRQVFDRAPSWGQGYQLVVSKGAIRKLVQGRSEKRNLLPYAGFLRYRMEAAEIVVSHDLEFFEDVDLDQAEEIEVTDADREVHDRIETPAMGTVYLTRHAVLQYEQRVSSGKPLNPWKSLTKRLCHPELAQQDIPERILRHKAMKFGRADNVEAWGHPNSKTLYLVVNNGERRTVVTVFERKPVDRM